jgi:ribonuclease D
MRNDADTILSIVIASLATEKETWPVRPEPPLAPGEGTRMKALKKFVRDTAEQLAMPAEVLIRKKEYESVIRSGMKGGVYCLPDRLKKWRYDVIGKGLLNVVLQSHDEADETPIQSDN